MVIHRRLSALVLSIAIGAPLALVMTSTSVAASALACEDSSNLCLDAADGAKWEAGKQATVKDRKKRSEKAPGTLSMTVEGGRGSLFVNGRYAGTAPLSSIDVASGRNDIQVRDGSTVLASGVLTVPKGGSLDVTVRHP